MPATTIGEARKVPEVESDGDGICMDRGHFNATAASVPTHRAAAERDRAPPNPRPACPCGPKLAQRFGETFRDYRAHTPEPPRRRSTTSSDVCCAPAGELRGFAASGHGDSLPPPGDLANR